MHRASLNHTFRVVWNEVTQTWVAVSEIARGRGKSKAVAAAVAATLLLPVGALHANTVPIDENDAVVIDDLVVTPTDVDGYTVTVNGGTPTEVPNDSNTRVATAAVSTQGTLPFEGSVSVTDTASVYVTNDVESDSAAAILVTGDTGQGSSISNAGLLDVQNSGTDASLLAGVYVAGVAGGSIVNTGEMEITTPGVTPGVDLLDSNGLAAGVYVGGGLAANANPELAGSIGNSGRIYLSTDVSTALIDQSSVTAGIYVVGDTGVNSTITNTGDIEALTFSDGAAPGGPPDTYYDQTFSAAGIRVDGTLGEDSLILNDGAGYIDAQATGAAVADSVDDTYQIVTARADGILVQSTGPSTSAGSIVNNEKIQALAQMTVTGFDVVGEVTERIAGEAYAEAYGIRVSGVSGVHTFSGDITNSGEIRAGADTQITGTEPIIVGGHTGSFAVGIALQSTQLDGTLENTATGVIDAYATADSGALNRSPDAEAMGIELDVVGSTGQVLNNGSILAEAQSGQWDLDVEGIASATATGIGAGNWLFGQLTNNGDITAQANTVTGNADATGIALNGVLGGMVTNDEAGTITATATVTDGTGDGSAVGIDAGGLRGTLSNAGTIGVTSTYTGNYGEAYADGITASQLGEDLNNGGTITNSGSLTVTAEATITGSEEYGGAFANGIDIYGPVYGTIANTQTGSISVSATLNNPEGHGEAMASGIAVYNLHGNIDNEGTLSATASASAGGDALALGVDVAYLYEGMVRNSGSITATATAAADDADAVGINIQYTDIDRDSSAPAVVNTGTITASATSQDEDARAWGIRSSGFDGLVGQIVNGTAPSGEAGPFSIGGAIEVTATTHSLDDSASAIGISVERGGYFVDYSLSGSFFDEPGTTQSAVLNYGSITVDASQTNGEATGVAQVVAGGIELKGGIKMGGVLNNAGSIDVTAESLSSQVSAVAVGMSVGVDLVDVSGQSADEFYATLLEFNSSSIDGQVINSGSISAFADQAGGQFGSGDALASGVLTGDVSGEAASVINTEGASIVAEAISDGAAAAVGVSLGGGIFAPLEGEYTTGLKNGAAFENHGDITAVAAAFDGYAVASGVSIGVVEAGSTVTNTGNIAAAATSLSGEEYATASGVAIGVHNGHLQNSGTIYGSAMIGEDKMGFGTSLAVESGTGTVTNAAGGRLIGGLKVGSTGDFRNDGQIVLKNGVDLDDVNNTGMATGGYVAGNYIQGETGVLHIAALGAGESEYSTLRVGGNATLESGASAYVDVKTAAPGFSLLAGQTLEGVLVTEGEGGVEGNFAGVTDNSALLKFSSVRVNLDDQIVGLDDDAYRIDLRVESDRTVTDTVVENTNPAGTGAAGVFDQLIAGGGNEAMQPIIEALNLQETGGDVSDAVSQTLPLLQGGSSKVTLGSMVGVNRIIQARQEGQLGRSSGDSFYGDKKVWLKPMGSWADQKDRDGFSGYDARTYGLVLGADAVVSDNQRVGVAFAWSDSRVDSNNAAAPQRSNVDNYQLALYGSHNLSEATDVNYQLSVGRHTTEGRRVVDFGGLNLVAASKYNSTSFHAGAGIAHTMKLSEQTDFTPSVRVDYMTVRDKAYAETGAGALNLNVGSNRAETLRLGADAKFTFRTSDTTTLTANAGLSYDAINKRPSVVAAFAGAPGLAFTTQGLKPSAMALNVGAGVVTNLKDGLQLTGRVDVEARSGYTNTTASVKLRWNW